MWAQNAYKQGQHWQRWRGGMVTEVGPKLTKTEFGARISSEEAADVSTSSWMNCLREGNMSAKKKKKWKPSRKKAEGNALTGVDVDVEVEGWKSTTKAKTEAKGRQAQHHQRVKRCCFVWARSRIGVYICFGISVSRPDFLLFNAL